MSGTTYDTGTKTKHICIKTEPLNYGSLEASRKIMDSSIIGFLSLENFTFQQHQLKDLSTAIAQSDVARRKKLSTDKKETSKEDKKANS